jgi:hypothetical protein
MATILDAPMAAHRAGKLLHAQRQTTDVVSFSERLDAFSTPSRSTIVVATPSVDDCFAQTRDANGERRRGR